MKITSESQIKNICCIGAGYVGGPTMAIIAKQCPEIVINVVDINEERIAAWNSIELENLPVFEPNLDKVIEKTRNKNLFFSNKVAESISIADLIFISVNTPTKQFGLGAGQASDLKWVEACAREVAKYAKGHTIVVEKSTMPVRTADVIKTILISSSNKKNYKEVNTFSVLSNPEFLSEGNAISDLENPDRILIGGDDKNAIKLLKKIYKRWVPGEKILETSLWSSELSKLTANAFLAQRISSINSISSLCEATGADINEVSLAVGTDSRIGNKFLNASPGFGGSCFHKDLSNLLYLCNYFGLPEVANYWEQVIKLNEWQKSRISEIVIRKLFGNLSGKKIIILGFAFKANTNDTRESPAIKIINELLEEGAYIGIHDPKVSKKQIEKDLNKKSFEKINQNGSWFFLREINDAGTDIDAFIILTEWKEYKNIEWEEISHRMRKPSWVFDTRSIVNYDSAKKAGLNLWRVGFGNC